MMDLVEGLFKIRVENYLLKQKEYHKKYWGAQDEAESFGMFVFVFEAEKQQVWEWN